MADRVSTKSGISMQVQPQPQTESLPYRLREHFLSTPEIALYRALKEMTGDRYIVYAKVALNDIFLIVRPNENVHYFNKIFRKHVDFLLCNPRTLKPEIGIELVKPIAKNETRHSDQFMEDLFLTAGIPLVHIPSSEHYQISDIISLFQLAVTKARTTANIAGISGDSIPMCPVCGKMMVLRTHHSGSKTGQLYYGCIDNPRCPGTVVVK
ncbi:MAG TPA: DUF2726 domain-containing protein [Anaerolineales bacterium]|nr:DUF2726 domain-containing protein [Anaerolineales bacterium]